MPRRLPVLTMMLLLAGGFALRAGDTPEARLEQARKLRDKREPQAALDILEQLAKNPPPSLAGALSLELAKTRAVLALQQEVERRPAYLLKARAELTAWVTDPKTADPAAVVEAARIDVLLGKATARQAALTTDPRGAENLLT